MERLIIVGASYRHAPVAALGSYALPKDEIAARLPRIAADIGAPELAYIGTCNRVEFVLAGAESASAEDYRARLARILEHTGQAERRMLRAWQGDGAMEHLLLVASGLDSARRGEPEIRTQVRAAWRDARRAGTCGPILNRLFADALKTAAEVQAYISTQIGILSLSDGALAHVARHLAGRGRAANVALIGVSPMTRRCAQALSKQGHRIVVASRTLGTAQELADSIGAAATTIDAFKRDRPAMDVILSAAGGQDEILGLADVQTARDSNLLIVDFGVPANIDPAVADLPGVCLIDMDRLIDDARMSANQPELALAREIIDRHLDHLRAENALREAGPAIRGIVAHYQAITQSSLAKELAQADVGDRQRLEAWADLMARRFMHSTLAGVRALATQAEPAAVSVFLRGLTASLKAEARPDATPDTGTTEHES